MATYLPGNEITLSAEFIDRDTGEPADPTTVTLTILSPDGDETTVDQGDLSNPSVGVWEYDYTTVTPIGKWYYGFAGTGAIVATGKRSFVVKASVFA